MVFDIEMLRAATKLNWWLKVKYFWYKHIRRLDVIGFYNGHPLIRAKEE